MLIDSDIFVAYLKSRDWLRDTATEIFSMLEEGTMRAQASSEVFHELYYVFSEFAPLSIIKGNLARIAITPNLTFIPPTCETYVMAVHLLETFNISSIFDAIHAATALGLEVADHVIVSTDQVFDRVAGLRRVDPRTITQEGQGE